MAKASREASREASPSYPWIRTTKVAKTLIATIKPMNLGPKPKYAKQSDEKSPTQAIKSLDLV